MRKRSAEVSLGLLAAATTVADAHTPFKGANAFYTGLLHPVVVPSEALAVVALALLFGTSGALASRLGLALFATGLLIGLCCGQLAPAVPGWTTPALLAVALLMAIIVTTGLRPPPGLAAVIAVVTGAIVGLDALPDASSGRDIWLGSAATILGGLIVAVIVSGLIVNGRQHWRRIAIRVAGSWITASAVLYFAWLFATHQS